MTQDHGAPASPSGSQASPEAAGASSPSVSIPSAWNAGAFTSQTVGGPRLVAGWLSERFALDFRVFEDENDLYGAWHLTHLPTGYSICHFKDSGFSEVTELVTQLRAMADWSFSEPAASADCVNGFSEFRKTFPAKVRRGSALFSCASISPASDAQGIAARSDETLKAAQPEGQEPGAGTACAKVDPNPSGESA